MYGKKCAFVLEETNQQPTSTSYVRIMFPRGIISRPLSWKRQMFLWFRWSSRGRNGEFEDSKAQRERETVSFFLPFEIYFKSVYALRAHVCTHARASCICNYLSRIFISVLTSNNTFGRNNFYTAARALHS